jgi:hypothetical protein
LDRHLAAKFRISSELAQDFGSALVIKSFHVIMARVNNQTNVAQKGATVLRMQKMNVLPSLEIVPEIRTRTGFLAPGETLLRTEN